MRTPFATILCCATTVALAGCSEPATAPGQAAVAGAVLSQSEWNGSLRPQANMEVQLVGPDHRDDRGQLRFRQPLDAALTIFLDVQVRHLTPNTDYWFQRATDAANDIDGQCDSQAWLTLGLGAGSQVAIHTDEHGDGEAALFRTLPDILEGSAFDIHFRVVASPNADGNSPAVLESGCRQFVSTR